MANDTGLLAGRTLGNCTLVRLLGQGGMGAVYLARQVRPKRNVAVKILHPALLHDGSQAQQFLARFRREADVIARLEHVHIMPIYAYGEQDGLTYLVMPYLAGGSLRDILTQRGAIPLAETINYLSQAASALDYAHAQGIIHRDLKPANFLLHADGRLVLTDFGIARIIEEQTSTLPTLTHTGMIVGTPDYMAPEMARGEPIDYRVDIYELGIVLFQMLSGHVPFTGSTPYAIAIKHIQEPPPSLHQSNPTIPAAVDAVIQKATAKQPADRYASAKEMVQALQQASAEASTVVAPPAPAIVAQTFATEAAPIEYDTTRMQPPHDWSSSTTSNTRPDNAPIPPVPQPYQPLVPTGPYTPTTRPRKQRQAWLLPLVALLILLVIGTSTFVVLHLVSAHNAPTPIVTASTSTPAPNTNTPTPTSRSVPSPTATATTTTPPVGSQLYAASAPGSTCDQQGGTWEDFMAQHACQYQGTTLTNTATTSHLGGTFLTAIPGHNYPADYVVQAQFQLAQQSSSEFGIYFRNQPGAQAEGTYTFLIHTDGSWSADVYDNTTGNPTTIASGSGAVSDIHAAVTLAVAVSGTNFTFYVNGKRLGHATDSTYSTGTVGLAINQGGSMTVSHFVLDAIATTGGY